MDQYLIGPAAPRRSRLSVKWLVIGQWTVNKGEKLNEIRMGEISASNYFPDS